MNHNHMESAVPWAPRSRLRHDSAILLKIIFIVYLCVYVYVCLYLCVCMCA